ncbi:hypothetical protein LOZ04_006885 [Ophidiomyces ophidiicola]|uniref:Uncharacterized protein n=1 Tax=Ophidiomyces ophidiicola TaxID=1387563 RepID=A0ACB8ULM5_9EURO|nr:hypothetical protein LOZ62_006898 [Ophidiomyces ophidiicola]KAI2042619.1 hypothetical protein LOZ38_006847 [Ophidiomyces ophidiicola]KAI2063030.1 hypothetical protein LOZ37_006781 [Ophidiomyces ophidiicola]KAI2081157.1 hypothetical protein LOZ36_006289 [Ophidiomyces ophidiicola]KAI2085084.1 hypothetical protein LOZ33_006855 [Ophidiomyces ophidiicola]
MTAAAASPASDLHRMAVSSIASSADSPAKPPATTTTTNPPSSALAGLPTIRLFPHHAQAARPALPFTPVARTLPDEACVIRVGRYSERDGVPVANPGGPSAAPIGFKSKVVSRKHCEFSVVAGQWHVKDVGSSSGTFLNHMRLSQPNTASRLYAVHDGDVVQLGIDFRGGEELIFRCVRIRIECNRLWQRGLNEFNKNTERLINSLGKGIDDDYKGCRECSICLNSVLRPYQCLFMAACAHVWHYKCIRRLIHTPEYPMFQCPNCRAYTDLSADVDDSNDLEADVVAAAPAHSPDLAPEALTPAPLRLAPEPAAAREPPLPEPDAPPNNHHHHHHHQRPDADADDTQVAQALHLLHIAADDQQPQQDHQQDGAPEDYSDNPTSHRPTPMPSLDDIPRSRNIDIPRRDAASAREEGEVTATTATMTTTVTTIPPARLAVTNTGSPFVLNNFDECPLTPRNDLGPLALDGRAGRLL